MTAETRVFAPSGFYGVVTALGIVVAALFGWEFGRTPGLGALLFLGIGIGITLWSLRAQTSRVAVTRATLCLVRPWQAERCVAFRQLVSVAETGRLNPVLLLVYHPAQATGLLDLDSVETLELPAVRDQDALLAQLKANTPQ